MDLGTSNGSADAPRAGDRQPLIKVRGLAAGFDNAILMKDVNFEVFEGEVFVILGGSGSGKSTLLKHMIGLYRPRAGHVWIDGEDITLAEGETRLRILRRIGVMYQSGALFGSMSLLENVCLPLEEHTDLPPDAIELIARIKLQLVGLNGSEHLAPAELSGGMQKRAAIARAMALEPCLVFLDEPSAGLDPITAAELDRLIVGLARGLGITFVVVTHELQSIYAIADRAIMLDKRAQGIIAEGKPQDLRDHSDNPWVRHFFRREPEPQS
jgi:phospholipid/cholesterol/gamma-HCH transport system ATP-binding protein